MTIEELGYILAMRGTVEIESPSEREDTLRAWHIRGNGNRRETIHIPVSDVEQAIRVLDWIAQTDLADNAVDWNAQGLDKFDGKEWIDYEDDDGSDFDEIRDAERGE